MTPSLRSLPSVEKLLSHPTLRSLSAQYGPGVVTEQIRTLLQEIRTRHHEGQPIPAIEELVALVQEHTVAAEKPSLQRVVNASGIVLHTNLGRAPLGDTVYAALQPICRGYSNVEFDLAKGERGERNDHIRETLRTLTGAEDALVVNNNAAAVLLILSTFARNREAIVSRGELIEIGGAFRIPEVMAQSGARMIETGTTNRTRIADYEAAITEDTALLFKAHRSNFYIGGFTEEVSLAEMTALSRRRNLISVYDLGSGLLRKRPFLPAGEPDVASILIDGIDLVCFSGDKLLGGPQAGIILGRSELIAQLHRAPLYRALRVDKLTLAALHSVLMSSLDDSRSVREIPAYAFLHRSPAELQQLAQELSALFTAAGIPNTVEVSVGRCGGGTLPQTELPSQSVCVATNDAVALRQKLLTCATPILAEIREGRLVFDVLTLFAGELPIVAAALKELS